MRIVELIDLPFVCYNFCPKAIITYGHFTEVAMVFTGYNWFGTGVTRGYGKKRQNLQSGTNRFNSLAPGALTLPSQYHQYKQNRTYANKHPSADIGNRVGSKIEQLFIADQGGLVGHAGNDDRCIRIKLVSIVVIPSPEIDHGNNAKTNK